MPLTGHKILIVENEIGFFVRELQKALEAAGAETLVARSLVVALVRMEMLTFTAVAASAEHSDIEKHAKVPLLIYGQGFTPRKADVVVTEMIRLMKG